LSEKDYRLLALVFHEIIYSFQVTVLETLGNSDMAILHLADQLCQTALIKDVDFSMHGFEELVGILAEQVEKLGIGRVVLEKLGEENFVFRFEDCIWADYVHKRLGVRDVTCPFGLIALSMFQSSTGKNVYMADSMYSETGSATSVHAVEEITNQILRLFE
jgi:hypothetical protein